MFVTVTLVSVGCEKWYNVHWLEFSLLNIPERLFLNFIEVSCVFISFEIVLSVVPLYIQYFS